MANDIPLRYTDENYVTKAGLKSALHMSLVDDFWKGVLSYRKNYEKKVELPNVAKVNFHYTASMGVNAKIAAFSAQLESFQEKMAEFEQVSPNSFARFERELLLPELQVASAVGRIEADELALKAMLKGVYNDFNPEAKEKSLSSYLRQERKLHSSKPSSYEDFFGESYFALLGRGDLSYFYREKDLTSIYTTALFGRGTDSYAPFGEIPRMMESLFRFLDDASVPLALRASAGVYYCYYVRPFETQNELTALLLGKALLQTALPSYSYLLPLESCLKLTPELRDVLNQTLKDCDLTYFTLHLISVLSPWIEETLSSISKAEKEEVAEEFLGKPEEVAEEKASLSPSSPSLNEAKEKKVVASPEVEDKPKESKVPLLTPEEEKSFSLKESASAIAAPRPSYSDKEVKETARYLLETNPSLSKKQALFYASHCTLGRFYTIQDFKKASRCAYETARTSMDALSELGFYAKKQIKNKFVYTPIKQGEEK